MTQIIERMNPSTLPDAGAMGYSQISKVQAGRMAYISGQVAWDSNGGPTPSDLAEQTKLVCENASAALAAIGATTEDIAIARIFVTDLTPARMEVTFPLIVEWFDRAHPCVTGVGVAALAAPDLQIELELTVRLPD